MKREHLDDALDGLKRAGWRRSEVFAKHSRVRRFENDAFGEVTVLSEEMGWCARAGSDERSFLLAVSGLPRGLAAWPAAALGGLRLPEARGSFHWRSPADLDTPLLGEGEGHRLLRSISESLANDCASARVVSAQLEDGAGDVAIRSTEGVDARYRSRLATIRLEFELQDAPKSRSSVALAARCAADFRAAALGRRLADIVHVRSEGEGPQPGCKEVLLSPEVGSHILGALSSVFVGPGEAWLEDRSGRVGSQSVVLVEDGGFRRGPISAPVDGEGVPNVRRVLVDRGVLGDRILPWWSDTRPRGSRLRPGWREGPELGASQVFLEALEPVPVASLLSEVKRGCYLIESPRVGSFDLPSGDFSLPVCGFNVIAGRPVSPLRDVRLRGNLKSFLHCIRAAARDLSFHARGPIVGSPTMLVSGLELSREER